jgi:glycosyltransferase involved in cell wall biosynthesis
MKVLVLTNMAPFIWGGAEELTHHLVRNLLASGHEAEAFRIPFSWQPAERLIEEIALNRSLRLWNIDRVIALKFPTYHVPWDNKVIWLLHQYRQAYDLFDAGQTNIADDARGREIRRIIHAADNATFRSARKIFANSTVTADRLAKYNGFASEVLMPPLNDPELFTEGEYGGYILAAGRVNAGKRQGMLIDAMRYLPSTARLVIAGPPDSDKDEDELRMRLAGKDFANRVTLRLSFLPRPELADLVRNARAVAYLPYDEDSIGYVTMEALQAGKPVITTTDSGGVRRFVKNGDTGFVAEPNPEALAIAMAPLFDSRILASKVGRQARAAWLSLGLNWPNTIEKLMS